MLLLQALNDESTASGFQFFEKLGPKFFYRLVIDFASVFILIRFIYFPVYKNRENFFTFFIFNLIIFLITFILNKSDMSMGAAFGLFAVFSMLRYRTEGITTKDMTYLFLVIAVGLITALSKGNPMEISFINIVIILFTLLLETRILFKKEVSQVIQYENIELIKPELRKELKEDLERRMGITINRIEIYKVDFLNDTAAIRVFHYEIKE
ncbi:MAG TPA: DUF4956 domain-containing protein [Bacteroidia bacterium]|jgi:hypothetical protein|nr:DUF4956 domain-containing protein [Bacteroidia bacterium]